ncbi:hypothetical protein [Comamonas sp. GB3 AK4-5]|uniref:hypothetical protein n=1 Tax=Comamonas sp. GB3 AK4-5 TaxID=3231487 RepID=UPI00351DC743
MSNETNDQRLSQLEQAVHKQNQMLSEMLALLRKSEERQARADRMHEAIRQAQMHSPAGELVSAMRARAATNAEVSQ